MKSCLENCRVGDKIVWGSNNFSCIYTVDKYYHNGVGAYLDIDGSTRTIFTNADINPTLAGYVIRKIIKNPRDKGLVVNNPRI